MAALFVLELAVMVPLSPLLWLYYLSGVRSRSEQRGQLLQVYVCMYVCEKET